MMIDETRRQYIMHRIRSKSVAVAGGCVKWQGTKTKAGYGLIHAAMKLGDGYKSSLPAHRAMYMAFHNIILNRQQHVCHKCDNPSCVNINHLFVGTAKDNAQDMIEKGRKAHKYRLHTKQRKFDDATIQMIKSDSRPLKVVAEDYIVSVGYVSKLRNGKAKTLL